MRDMSKRLAPAVPAPGAAGAGYLGKESFTYEPETQRVTQHLLELAIACSRVLTDSEKYYIDAKYCTRLHCRRGLAHMIIQCWEKSENKLHFREDSFKSITILSQVMIKEVGICYEFCSLLLVKMLHFTSKWVPFICD